MLLVWMSLNGSIPLIIFLVLWLVQRSSFNYLLGKILLYLSMVFYLMPFQLLTGILPENVYDAAIVEKIKTLNAPQFHFEYGNSAYVTISDGIMWIPRWLIYVLCIWFVAVFIFAIYQVAKYRRSMRYLVKDSEERAYNLTGIGTVPILINNNIRTPYAVGFIHSRIIFPEDLIESKYNTLIYRHEYCRAKNYDALVKLICLIIICLHWFNPAAILLWFAYGNLCEYVCDDYATEGLKQNERKEYANMLLDVSAAKTMPVVWRNNFSSTRYLFQRRLMYIMKKQKFSKIQKLVTAMITAVTVIASSITVFAYEPMQSSSEEAITILGDGDYMEFVFDEDDENNNFLDSIYFDGHDEIFVLDSGEYIILDNYDVTYAICNHVFKSGTYYKHVSDGNGGCTVYAYYAQICTKCNYIKVGTLKSTTIFPVCTHS